MANISTIKVGDTSYGIAPASHASTATTYGAASASNYGHVKLSDNYTSSAGAAASGIGASSLAVYNAYNTLNSNLNSMKPSALHVRLATGDDTLVLPTNYIVTKLGTITIPPKCVATIMSRANVRTGNSDIEFALGINTEDVYSMNWGATHKNAPLYCVMSDTWIAINESTSSIVCYLFGRASVQTTLMYTSLQAFYTPMNE